MAKRVATKGKPKQYRRETNAQRAAREDKRQEALKDAKRVAKIIRATREAKAELVHQSLSLLPQGMDLSEWTLSGPERWKEPYAYLGYICCRSNENPPKFLRLVADILEGRLPYSPGDDWYDSEITKAYEEACCRTHAIECRTRPPLVRDIPFKVERRLDPDGKIFPITRPTFSEFESIFRQQNPTLQGASDRSLRRSLRRLGYGTRPAERGRPRAR
jgi:hypothetical protein